MKQSKMLRILGLVIAITLVIILATPMAAQTSAQNGQVRVWVEYQPGTAGQVEAALNRSGAELHYRFDDMNTFVASLPGAALEGIRRNPNVVMIEEDAIRYADGQDVPYGIDMVQAREVWDANFDGVVDEGAPTGAGVTVCIIDSGLFTGHEDFAGVNVLGGAPDDWARDHSGHGTHVAGTITAVNNELGVVGVTPGGVSLYIFKVFGDDGLWTYASTLANAARDCAKNGADIISMSLGGGNPTLHEERVFDDLYAQGILPIAAAGNTGLEEEHFPASYASVMSVAAIDSEMEIASFSTSNPDVEIAAPGVHVLSTVPYLNTNTLTVDGVTYSGNHVEFAAYAEAGVTAPLVDGGLCLTTGDWAGKTVLCKRGDIAFFDKVMNVQNSGGVAAVIYNNLDEPLNATLGEGNSSVIPAISLTLSDGEDLVDFHLGEVSTLVSKIEYEMSSYEAWDGTSMATPHVSGVAALIWSANPAWTAAQVREAMDQTALDLGDPGRDKKYGFGLVQAKAALDYLGGGEVDLGSLGVTVETNKAVYSNRENVVLIVTVTDKLGMAVVGADVALTIDPPAGKNVVLSGVTGEDGTVTFKYKAMTVKAGAGEYLVSASAAKDGYTSGSGTTSFVVQ